MSHGPTTVRQGIVTYQKPGFQLPRITDYLDAAALTTFLMKITGGGVDLGPFRGGRLGGWCVDITLYSMVTRYFNGSGPESPNPLHGTLGAHEDAHKAVAREFWTESNVRRIQTMESYALWFVNFPPAPWPDNSQVRLIGEHLYALHHWEQQTKVERRAPPRPVFRGFRNGDSI